MPTLLQIDLAHRQAVAELCMLFKIKSNPMHPLSGALPLPYVPACVTRGALVTHRHSYASPHCRTSQYRRTLCPSRCLTGTILVTVCLMVCDWQGSRAEEPMLFCWHDLLSFVSYYFIFFFLPWVVMWGWGLWTDSVLTLSRPCTADSS